MILLKVSLPHEKNLFLKITIFLFVILMCILLYIKIHQDRNPAKILEEQKSLLFSTIDKNTNGKITKYSIYGTHFNLEGTLDIIKISGIRINYVDLIVKNLNGDEYSIKSDFKYSDETISFSTSDEINQGIDLENLEIADYYILLKVTYSNSDIKYYSLVNSSEYEDITYYSLTQNNSNHKIDISFQKYNDISYMAIQVSKVDSLPNDVYDIAIDPGHGGLDKGAVSGEYTESELALNCALILKSKLEDLGLKVFVSRDENSSAKEDTANNMYDGNGRINKINGSKSKVLLSLHINSNTYDKNTGGVEVYAPSNCNLEFASLLAKNIVEKANSYYSQYKTYQKLDGVYVRNFTTLDITSFKSRAEKSGYEPYSITTSTPYLYIIRETGGICTNAFVDGRNTDYGKNSNYLSNIGTESYSIELGYMAVEKDLNNIIQNSDSYMNGIVEAIKIHYNL